jgi:DSF synthase
MNAPVRHDILCAPQQYQQLVNEFDPTTRTLWSFMKPTGRACFNVDLLKDIADFEDTLRVNHGFYQAAGELLPVNFVVFASSIPGIFNLGGDLATFRAKIQSGDKNTLKQYAYRCIDNIWNRLNHYHTDIATISLIQGQALGGGFEAALTADVLIAEEGSVLGLPEILFNLFPGMGALSLLARRIGLRRAEEIVLSGETYTAQTLHEWGVVDVLAPQGEGKQAVEKWIKLNSRRRNGYRAVQRSKQHIMPIRYDELIGIADIWVDSAMQLEERDLKMMGRLVQAQNKIGTTMQFNYIVP